MKRTIVLFTAFSFITFFLFSVIHPVAQEMEPSEPEIVLPSVVLEIEDLSVENVRAKLPENELVPPEIEVPLPEAEELQIEEPPSSFQLPKMGPAPVSGKKGGSFIAEGARFHCFSLIKLRVGNFSSGMRCSTDFLKSLSGPVTT